MNNRGFIKLNRSILDWRWYRDLNTRALFIHLLLTAAWEDTPYMNRVIKRGQCCTTVKELSTNNRQTVQQTRTALLHLQSTNEISIESTPKFSIITITNYDAYQKVNTQTTNERQAEKQTVQHEISKPTIYKEKKNIRNEEEKESGLRQLLDSVVGEYNSVCVSLEPVNGELPYHLAQLIRQAEKELHGVTFREYFMRAERSEFLTGKTGKFKADFSWLLRPENIAKVLSGKYDVSYQSGGKEITERDYNAPLW